ncbi:MAG: hypothetical protein IKU06_03110 [Lachnospiraceae bacterium]|nr:hypothetical protein [Lachnospiraceae bacterium]
MLIGFIIWGAVALVLFGIGVWDWNSKTAVGFYSGVKPPEVTDVRKYNHSVAILWFVYAILFTLLGLPLMLAEQNSPGVIFAALGVVFITIGLVVAYSVILAKYEAR